MIVVAVVLALALLVVLALALVAGRALIERMSSSAEHTLTLLIDGQRALTAALAESHQHAMRDAMAALRSSVDSVASTMRPAAGVILPDVFDETDVMAGFELPDVIPDWTDELIASDDVRPDAIMFDPAAYDPGAEIGIRL